MEKVLNVAKEKDRAMEKVKAEFSAVTTNEVIEFSAQVKALYLDFKTNGPGDQAYFPLIFQVYRQYRWRMEWNS
jgi:carbohydrate-binding DOMON domain-containing protein